MKANTFEYPKSSFLAMPKDTSLVVNQIISNPNILKLLRYNTPDALRRPPVGSEELKKMIKTKQIAPIPQITVDSEEKTYLRLYFDNFRPSETNTYYRDHTIEIRIISHFNIWTLDDFDLRPFRIAGEIDAMLDGKRLTGIGLTRFLNATQDVYNNEFGGITLEYLVVRGNEDKVNPLNG